MLKLKWEGYKHELSNGLSPQTYRHTQFLKDLVFILNQETLETFSEAIFEAIAFNLIYRIPIENGSEDDGKEILEGETTKRK